MLKLAICFLAFAVVVFGQECDCGGFKACVEKSKQAKHAGKQQCFDTCKSNLDPTLRNAMETCKPQKDESKFGCILDKVCTTTTGTPGGRFGGPPFGGRGAQGGPPFGDRAGKGGPPFGDSVGKGGPPFGNRTGKGGPPFGDRAGRGGPPFGDSVGKGGPPFGNRTGKGGPPFGDRAGKEGPPFANLGGKGGFEGPGFGKMKRGGGKGKLGGHFGQFAEFLSETQKTSLEAFGTCMETNCKRDEQRPGPQDDGCHTQFPNCGMDHSKFRTAAEECGLKRPDSKSGGCECITQQLGITEPSVCEGKGKGRGGPWGGPRGDHPRDQRSVAFDDFAIELF